MDTLSDELLIDSYIKASELNLNEAFIQIIKEEIIKRSLEHFLH